MVRGLASAIGQSKHRISQVARSFRRNCNGIAALEFGLIAPFAIYTLLAAGDIGNALSMERRLTNAADTIAQIISQQSTNGTIATSITDANIVTAFNSIMVTFPDVFHDAASKGLVWEADIQPIVSSVIFGTQSQCVVSITSSTALPNCTTATAVWSAGFNYGSSFTTMRPCGPMTLEQASTPSLSYSTMPSGLYLPGSVIVVDITYVFTPNWTRWLTGPFTIHRSAYIQPRFFTQIPYTGPNGGSAPSNSVTTYTDSSAMLKSCTLAASALPQ